LLNKINKTIMNKLDVLQKCTVEGNIVRLPAGQLDRKLYMEVAKSLELIGGKWKGNKVMGFVFNEDPTQLLEQIATGENRNLKKEFQFFATPENLAVELIELACYGDPITGKILEPSAGQGSIINAIHKYYDEYATVRYCEIMPINQSVLSKIPRTEFIGDDFLCLNSKDEFATIIANPPFSKNQDIDHIRKMYEVCKPGGRIVTIASRHWQGSQNKKEVAFREWIYNDLKADVREIDPGTFSESGTKIGAYIIIINKEK